MPKYRITAPDGRTFDVEGDGTADEALAHIQSTYQAPQAEPAATPKRGTDWLRQVALSGKAAAQGVVGTLVGLSDAQTNASNALGQFFGVPRQQPLSERFNELLDRAGSYSPETSGEQYASAGIRGVTGALTGSPGASVPNAIRAGIAGLTGSLSAEGARQAGAGPATQFAAGLAGGLAPTAIETGARWLASVAARAWAPLTRSGQEQTVANIMGAQATDPKAALQNLQAVQPIVPGSPRTTGEASRDYGLLSLEKGVRGKNPEAAANVISQQNTARQDALTRLGGSPADIAKAQAARDSATGPMRNAALGNANGAAPIDKVHATIDSILSSPVGKRDSVSTALGWAKEKVGNTTDPAALYEIRKDLQLAQRGKYQPSSPNAPNASTLRLASGQLGDVIKSLDDAIESVAPGFKAYLQRYKDMSRPIDQMKVIQEIQQRAELSSADIKTGQEFLGSAKFAQAMDRAIQKNGAKLDPAQIQQLNAIRADMQMGQAVNSPALKAPGSDTFQNLSIAQVMGAGATDAHPVFKVLSQPLRWVYKLAGSDAKVNDILAEAMLDPKIGAKLLQRATPKSVQTFSNAFKARLMAGGVGAALSATQQTQSAGRSTSPESPGSGTAGMTPQR